MERSAEGAGIRVWLREAGNHQRLGNLPATNVSDFLLVIILHSSQADTMTFSSKIQIPVLLF